MFYVWHGSKQLHKATLASHWSRVRVYLLYLSVSVFTNSPAARDVNFVASQLVFIVFISWKQLPAGAGNELDESDGTEPDSKCVVKGNLRARGGWKAQWSSRPGDNSLQVCPWEPTSRALLHCWYIKLLICGASVLFPLSPSVPRWSNFCFRGSIELLHEIVFRGCGDVKLCTYILFCSLLCVCITKRFCRACVFVLGHLPQSSHIPLCFAAGAEWVYVQGSMVLQGGGGLVVVCVGSHAALIHGFALSLELGPWLSLPEVAAGGRQCAVIPNSVSVLCLWYKYRKEIPV